MFVTKTVLVVLIHASLYLITRGQGGVMSNCLEIADVALVVDVSGSIEGDGEHPGYFDQFVKPFIKRFAQGLNVGPGKTQVGLVTFGNVGILEFPLTSDINEVIRRIELFDYYSRGKNTNTSGGINVMRTQLLSPTAPNYRPNAAHIAVVITDGISTIDHDQTIPSAKKAQSEGIIMLAVGVTDASNVAELTAIASPLTSFNISGLKSGVENGVFTPSGTVAYVPEIEDLVTVVSKLVTYLKDIVCTSTGNCPRGDKAEWCDRLPLSNCSIATVADTCCKTCAQLKVTLCNDYADLAFVVDVSGSIGKDRNDTGYFDRQIKPFLRNFVRRLNVAPGNIQIGMVTFGNKAYFQFPLTSDINEVIRGIDNVVYPIWGEYTNTSGGIYIMRTRILGPNSPNYRQNASHVAIVVTDGQSNLDQEKTLPSARDAKNQGISIFTVGATNSINLLELIGIASTIPGLNTTVLRNAIAYGEMAISGSVAYTPSIENLDGIVTELTRYLSRINCNQISRQNLETCHDKADIAFVVDMSGSIEGDGKNPGAFDLYVKPFLKSIVEKLNVAPDKIHIGLVTFGNEGRLEFPLLSNSTGVVENINGIAYNSFGENTNTSGGINVMRTQVLSSKSPNYRSNAAHIAIVVTDGLSTYDHNKTVPSANQAKKEGIIMLSIGVTKNIDLQELMDISSPLRSFDLSGFEDAILSGVFRSNGYVSYVPEFEHLVKVVNELAFQISKALCLE